jgi:hypothetical protein
VIDAMRTMGEFFYSLVPQMIYTFFFRIKTKYINILI